MSKNSHTRRILFIALAILVSVAFFPAGEAVSSFATTLDQQAVSTCSTQTNLFVLNVVNTGDEPDTYTVSLSGAASKWAVSAPNGFVLAPGEAQNIYIYVTPAKDALVGQYSLDITTSAASASSKTNSARVDVSECHSVTIIPDTPSQDVCSCTIATNRLVITNSGSWTENYQLSLSGSAAEFSTVSQEFLSLASGQSQDVYIFSKTPCNEIQMFDMSLEVKSLNSNAFESQDLSLNSQGCYDFEFGPTENYLSFCDNSEAKIPIHIENRGTVGNTYTFNVDGPEWSTLEREQITVAPGNVASVNLILSPGLGINGNFPVSVSAEGQDGEVGAETMVTANVLTCHQTSLEIPTEKDTICARNSKAYDISLANAGQFTENYVLEVDGPDWARLGSDIRILEAGETTSIDLEVNPPADAVPRDHRVKVTATSQNIGRTSDSDSIVITVPQQSSCFGVRLTPEITDVSVVYGEGTLVPIVIENIGSETARYELDVSGTGASYAQLNPSAIEVSGHSSETVFLYVSVPEQTERGVYLITASARSDGDVVSSSSTITVKVVESAPVPITSEPEVPDGVDVEMEEEKSIFSRIKGTLIGWKDRVALSLSSFRESLPELPETPVEPETPEEPTPEVPEELDVPVEPEVPTEPETPKAPVEPETPTEPEAPEEPEPTIPELPKVPELPEFPEVSLPSFDNIKDTVAQYWYAFVVVIGALLLIFFVWRFDLFRSDEEDWLVELEEEYERPGDERGAFSRFKDWLEEEDEEDFDEPPKKPRGRPRGRPRKEPEKPSLRERIVEALTEEVEEEKPRPRARRGRPPRKEKGFFDKFSDWLEEEEEEERKPKPKPRGRPKKEKGSWDKFKDWLEEED